MGQWEGRATRGTRGTIGAAGHGWPLPLNCCSVYCAMVCCSASDGFRLCGVMMLRRGLAAGGCWVGGLSDGPLSTPMLSSALTGAMLWEGKGREGQQQTA